MSIHARGVTLGPVRWLESVRERVRAVDPFRVDLAIAAMFVVASAIELSLLDSEGRGAVAQQSAPAELDELTPRELEVFKLIARGLSNAEIAAELVVSETTVKTNVARVLMKLGVRDRVQAVVLAYESGVVAPGATLSE